MNRDEVKSVLKAKGIDESLLEMPAIVEPIYQAYMNCPKSMLEEVELDVDENGNFTFRKNNYTKHEDGGARITNEESTIKVNKYGIETSYADGSWMDFFSNMSRENGEVISVSGNNGNASYYRTTFLDTGSYSISKAIGMKVYEPKDTIKDDAEIEKLESAELDPESVLAGFDETSKTIIENYPQTAEWYANTREALEARLARQNDPKARTERKIARLEAKINSQAEKISRLQEKNEKLTRMLEKALDFMETVRKSPVGKMFFGRKLKKYEEDKKSLSDGR